MRPRLWSAPSLENWPQARCFHANRRGYSGSKVARPRNRSRSRSTCQTRPVHSATADRESSVSVQGLKKDLELAVQREDYEAAALLRDELRRRENDVRVAVEEANRLFYVAFEKADMEAMEKVWGWGDQVQCMHPAARCISGRDQVMQSWDLILNGVRSTNNLRLSLEDVRIYAGENDAFVTCVEVMDSTTSRGRTAATNIFEKQGEKWKLILHHGGSLPPEKWNEI